MISMTWPNQKPTSIASFSDADLINIANTMSWADILYRYDNLAVEYIYSLTLMLESFPPTDEEVRSKFGDDYL